MTVAAAANVFDKLFSVNNRIAQIIGLGVLNTNYKHNWQTYCMILLVIYYDIAFLAALWKAQTDLMRFLNIIPVGVAAIQGTHEVLLRVMRHADYRALQRKSRQILRMLSENHQNGEALFRSLHIAFRLQKVVYVIYHSVLILVLLPMIILLVSGEKVLSLELNFPGVDEKSTVGYWLNYLLHSIIFVAGGTKFLSTDALFFSYVFPISAYVDAMKNEIRELNLLLDQRKRSEDAITNQLERICKLHQMLSEYEKMLQSHYNTVLLVKIGSIVAGLICAIIVIFKISFYAAYFFYIIQLAQLTQQCFMGTVVAVKNEQLLRHLSTINWYLLPNQQAKHLIFILQYAQNVPNVSIGGFAPLDIESYVTIVKSIYSYVMILITFLE